MLSQRHHQFSVRGSAVPCCGAVVEAAVPGTGQPRPPLTETAAAAPC